MILESIAIQNFKRFPGRLAITGLQPGLNVFVGPNETGKSTIADAIRTLFLERYKTSTLKDIQPWKEHDGPPSVEAQFHISGVSHYLRKQFLSKQRCELRIGERLFREDEAEEQLASILGFARAGNRSVKAENAGIPGLLWVKQGTTQEIRESAGYAAHYLRDALASLSGGAIAGGQDVLITAVQRDLGQLLTERTRRPTGAYADTESQLQKMESDRERLRAQAAEFNEALKQLETQQAAFDEAQARRAWEELERRADVAQSRVAEKQKIEGDLREARQAAQLAHAELNLVLQHETTASANEEALAALRLQVSGAAAAANEAQASFERAQLAVDEAQRHKAEAQAAHDIATVAATVTNLSEQADNLKSERTRVQNALESALAASEALQEAAREAARLEIDTKAVEALKKTGAKLSPLRARRDAALPRIDYLLTRPLVVEGKPLSGEGQLAVTHEVLVEIPEVGTLRIVPGVTDLAALTKELDELERTHAQLLAQCGVDSLPAAEHREQAWLAAKAQQARQQEILRIHAPDGPEAMRTRLVELEAKVQALDARIISLPDTEDAPSLEDALARLQSATDRLEVARDVLAAEAEKRSSKAAALSSLLDSIQAREREVSSPEHQERRQAWKTAIVEKRTLAEHRTETVGILEQTLRAAEQEDPDADVKRLKASALLAREAQRERESRITRLRANLESAGATGLGETLAKLDASIEQATRRLLELKSRADALSMLEETLVQERDAVTSELRAPLTERLGHYVRRLFPRSQLHLTDDLEPVSLTREDQPAPLESLSWGTREQLGIFARLAYADMLKDAGRPTLLMLDDAAVHTDSGRRAILKKALLDAATRHQILLFSCHPESWDDMGVPQRSIDDLRVPASG
jgi:hypothetical protein